MAVVDAPRQRMKPIGFTKAASTTDVTPTGASRSGLTKMVLETKEYPVVVLYDKIGSPRFVPSGTGNVERCLRDSNPLYDHCPVCGAEHEGPDFDRCPALPEPKYMSCPMCAKKITEDRTLAVAHARAGVDPNELPLPAVDANNVGVRLKWEEHMVLKHPGTARMYGIDEVAVRDKFK